MHTVVYAPAKVWTIADPSLSSGTTQVVKPDRPSTRAESLVISSSDKSDDNKNKAKPKWSYKRVGLLAFKVLLRLFVTMQPVSDAFIIKKFHLNQQKLKYTVCYSQTIFSLLKCPSLTVDLIYPIQTDELFMTLDFNDCVQTRKFQLNLVTTFTIINALSKRCTRIMFC